MPERPTREEELKMLAYKYNEARLKLMELQRELRQVKVDCETQTKMVEKYTEQMMAYVGSNGPAQHVLLTDNTLVAIVYEKGVSTWQVIV